MSGDVTPRDGACIKITCLCIRGKCAGNDDLIGDKRLAVRSVTLTRGGTAVTIRYHTTMTPLRSRPSGETSLS